MKALILLAAGAALTSSGAFAGVVFSNPLMTSGVYDCSFSTTCASTFSVGDDFAAQEFTLKDSLTVITAADFTELDYGTTPTDVNWAIIKANGPGGLPGTIMASGTDVLSAASVGSLGGRLNLSLLSWSTGTVALARGAYYLAIQAISPVVATYLGQGQATSGAAETHNGGATWGANYGALSVPSVAVDLYGTVAAVPEPSTWAMFTLGAGFVGAALRRRARAAAA